MTGPFIVPHPKQLEWLYHTGNNILTRQFAVQSFAGSEFSEFTEIISATSQNIGSGINTADTARGTLTGTTSETVIRTATITGGTLGANDGLEFWAAGATAGTAGGKDIRVRWGGVSGTVVGSVSIGSVEVEWVIHGRLFNRDSTSSQVASSLRFDSGSLEGHTLATDTLDTTSDQDLVVTGDLGNSGDSIHVDLFVVKEMAAISDSAPASPPSPPPSSSEPPGYDPSERLRGTI